ncbi:MAG: hypothetical protein ACRC5R_02660 [Mycoplasmatales bacterium]
MKKANQSFSSRYNNKYNNHKRWYLVMAVKDSKFALVSVEELGQYYCNNKHVFIH